MPGVYTVQLKANGKTYTQPLTVRMDPRVKTALSDLQQQHDLAMRAYRGWDSALDAYNRVRTIRTTRAEGAREGRGAGDSVAASLRELDGRLGVLEGAGRRGPRGMRGVAT